MNAARALGLAAVAALAAMDAAACSCARDEAGQTLDDARTVALVRVRRVELNPEWEAQLGPDAPLPQPLRAEADVLETMRGTPLASVQLLGGYGEGGCALPLEPGDDILLVDGGTAGPFEPDFCSRSRVIGRDWQRGAVGLPVVPTLERRYVDAVREYLAPRTPIHECLTMRVPPPPPRPGTPPDPTRLDCWGWLREPSEGAGR